MNLEVIEEKVLIYLKQTSNPLVKVDLLHQHLLEEIEQDQISLKDLVNFLENHELFRLIQPLPIDDPNMNSIFESSGFINTPCVILDTRVPTPTQTATLMLEQLDQLLTALNKALQEATQSGEPARMNQILDAQNRIQSLKAKIAQFDVSEN
jgi:hypothetical protein